MFDVATEQKLFNEYLTPGCRVELKAKSKLFDRIKQSDKIDLGGLYAKQKLMMANSQASRASSNSGYPTAQQSTPGWSLVYVKRAQMFTLQFDGLALELAAKHGTSMPPEEFEKKGILITVADGLSRQLMGDGSGRIYQVNGAVVSSAVVNVNSPYYDDVRKFIKPGRVLDFYNAGLTKQVDSVAVQNVNSATQITMASSISCDDDCWIYDEDVYTGSEGAGLGEAMGLLGIVSDQDPPAPNAAAGLQGMLVATYPDWKAVVNHNSGTPRDLSEDLLTGMFDEVDGRTTVMLATHKIRRVYAALLQTTKQITNKTTFWGGFSGLTFIYDGKELPLVPDRFVPTGHIVGLDEGLFTLYVTTKGAEITWEKGRDGSFLQKVASKNEFVAEGHIFLNLGCAWRGGNWLLKDISETIPV